MLENKNIIQKHKKVNNKTKKREKSNKSKTINI